MYKQTHTTMFISEEIDSISSVKVVAVSVLSKDEMKLHLYSHHFDFQKTIMDMPIAKHPIATQGLRRSPDLTTKGFGIRGWVTTK